MTLSPRPLEMTTRVESYVAQKSSRAELALEQELDGSSDPCCTKRPPLTFVFIPLVSLDDRITWLKHRY